MREGALVTDKYKILRKIGEGGMGSVWVARNEMTEREFAIKFMSSDFAHSEALTARFLQEAKVAGRLRHPSLLEIFDAGVAEEFDGAPFLVMELLDGIPLDDAIHKAGRLPTGIALEIMSTVAHAMGVVHDKGIVHRDLKPANVFMHRPGTGAIVPKVLDFGISKVTTEDGRMKPSGLTQTGYVLGSPIYMSPEQASSDKTIDARSDIHALGVLLWECLTGTPPFAGENYNTLVVEIMVTERPRLDAVLPGASRSLADIVARAFAIKRDDRFPNAIALADALEAEMDRMGHVRVLHSRNGAAEFFRLLGRLQAESALIPPGSSTTSTHAVPARSEGGAPPGAASTSGPSTGAPVPTPIARAVGEDTRARLRWLIPLATAAVSVLIVGAVGIVWRLYLPTEQTAAPTADSDAVDPAESAPRTPADTAAAASASEPTSATAPAPSESASAPAAVGSSPPGIEPHTPPASTTRVGAPGTPAPTATATTPKQPSHHRVEDDGL